MMTHDLHLWSPGDLVPRPAGVLNDFGWIYVLLDAMGCAFYVGQTTDPLRRLGEANGHAQRWRDRLTSMLIVEGPLPRGHELDTAERAWGYALSEPGETHVAGMTIQHGELLNRDGWYTHFLKLRRRGLSPFEDHRRVGDVAHETGWLDWTDET